MNLIDYILDLFRSPQVAASFIADPEGALRDVGLPNVSAAQLASVAASAAPAGLALGGGNPVVGLQRAVADYHSFASPFSPQTSFAPQTQTEFASRNNTDLASNNDFASPDQSAGSNAQNGAFNLGFGDITLGDKSTNTATNGGVVVDGENDGDIVSGDGAVLGNDNDVNNGDVLAGTGSNVNIGEGDIEDNGTTATGDSTVIQDNEGTVLADVDASGGNGGAADGGGSLLGIGGGNASGGSAGGGGIVIVDNSATSTDVAGDQTTVEGDMGSDNTVDESVSSQVETSVDNDTETTVDDHGFTSNVASGNSTDIASHNDTDLASNNATELDAF